MPRPWAPKPCVSRLTSPWRSPLTQSACIRSVTNLSSFTRCLAEVIRTTAPIKIGQNWNSLSFPLMRIFFNFCNHQQPLFDVTLFRFELLFTASTRKQPKTNYFAAVNVWPISNLDEIDVIAKSDKIWNRFHACVEKENDQKHVTGVRRRQSSSKYLIGLKCIFFVVVNVIIIIIIIMLNTWFRQDR